MTTSGQHRSDLRPLTMSAGEDLLAGAFNWGVFTRLGWLEVKRRYRRTVIGPLWGSINLTVFVLALGTVGGGLLDKNFAEYLPFLAAGMIVWFWLSSTINESCTLFIAAATLFRQMQFSYSTLALALVWRNFVAFLHNIAIYFIAILLFVPHHLTLQTLWVVPGVIVVLFNSVWVALLLGMLCLRFRDLQQMVATFVQIAMFITPIFWPPDKLDGIRRLIFVDLNPLYSLIEIVRAPLLGTGPEFVAVAGAVVITVVGWSITFVLFGVFRRRIAYWA